MDTRPKIKLELSTSDKVVEIAGWLLVAATCVLVLGNYNRLPDVIPTHFDATGEVNAYGRKSAVLTLPLVSTALFLVLTILNKFPHLFNFPARITPDNALRQYTYATRLLRYLKLTLVLVFGLIAYHTIQIAVGNTPPKSTWFLPFSLLLIFTPVVFFIVKMVKSKS